MKSHVAYDDSVVPDENMAGRDDSEEDDGKDDDEESENDDDESENNDVECEDDVNHREKAVRGPLKDFEGLFTNLTPLNIYRGTCF